MTTTNDLQWLIGPVSFTYMTSTQGQQIWLFADDHCNQVQYPSTYNSINHCTVKLEQFMDNIINTQQETDFFLEVEYIKTGQVEYEEMYGELFLKQVSRHYHQYLQVDKSLRPNSNLRVHYSDVRSLLPPTIEYDMRLNVMLLDELVQRGWTQGILDTVNAWLRLLETQVQIPEDWSAMEDALKINKQLNKLAEPSLRVILQAYLQQGRTLTQSKLIQYLLQIKHQVEMKPLPLCDDPDELSDVLDSVIQLIDEYYNTFGTFFEVYLLARMMNSNTSKNVIVYAGYEHINRFIPFLQQHGDYQIQFHTTSNQEGIDFQCLNITDYIAAPTDGTR